MSASADADKEGRKVFLGGLAYESSEDDLRNDFGKYGELEDIQLPMGDGGKHKGFAFLTFRQPDDASYAVKQHHQRPYMGREISAKIVIPRAERTGGGERPGDWTCPACNASVFGSKNACFKCGEPKPRGGGGGGYGGGDRGGYGGGDRSRGDDRGYDRRDDRGYDRRDDRGYDRRDDRGNDRRDRDRSYSRGRDRRDDRRGGRDRSDSRDRGRDGGGRDRRDERKRSESR